MDVTAAWIKVSTGAKTARRVSATGTANTLDALSVPCAPFAARWDAEADRRAKLRTPEHLKALMDAQKTANGTRAVAMQAQSQLATAKAGTGLGSGQRRAARAATKATQARHAAALRTLKAARTDYPNTLTSVAVRAHAVHAVPAGLASTVLSLAHHDVTVWPASVSLSLIGLNAAALWLGRRSAVAVVEDGASAEERQLLERLDPAYWVEHAADRGLAGTVTTPPALEPGGIRCEIRLDGQWTVKALRERADSVSALLGARTALRMRITPASRGGWAVLSLATRSAAAHVSSLWTPERIPADPLAMSLGLDTETGDEVLMPFDERLLISGASGTGKSWSSRPLMATAHLRGDLLLIDGKGEEANIWEKVCRVAVEPGEVAVAIDQAHAEMNRRKRVMKERGISVWDGRQLTVVIDEGQVVLAQIMRDKARLQRLIELSSLGRSRAVVLWWATQYPVTDGGAPGVHKMIAPNLLTRFSLRVAGTTQAQVALDDCAHYAPHQIPEGREYRGHGYLKGYGPRLLRTWTLDDAGVLALPKSVWAATAPAVEPEDDPGSGGRRLTLVKDAAPVPAPVPAESVPAPAAPAGATNRDRVLDAIRDGARTARDVTDRTGLNKGTVSKAVAQLVDAGAVARAADGSLTAREVSA